jgi:dynein heavy chain
VEVNRFTELEDVHTELKLRRQVWEDMGDWDAIQDEWNSAEFSQLNTETMQGVLAKFIKNINQFEKGLPPNNLVPVLKQKIEKMKEEVCATSLIG